jgi:hypothetical protein
MDRAGLRRHAFHVETSAGYCAAEDFVVRLIEQRQQPLRSPAGNGSSASSFAGRSMEGNGAVRFTVGTEGERVHPVANTVGRGHSAGAQRADGKYREPS